MKKNFSITKKTIDIESERIKELLHSGKVTDSEITTGLLLLEELTICFCEGQKDDFAVNVTVRKDLGGTSLVLSSSGDEFNPLIAAKESDYESEDYYRYLIFQANAKKLTYVRQNSKNIVFIQVHQSGGTPVFMAVLSMVLGFLFGLVLKYIPFSAAMFIHDNVLNMIQTLFMNAISLLITPIVFFSLTTSISRFSGDEIGRIGLKFGAIYLIYAIASILIGFGLATPAFKALISPVSGITVSVSETGSNVITLKEILFNLIPSNLVTSILQNNVLQILIFSFIFAATLSQLGEKAQIVRNLFNEFDMIFMKLMMYVIFFMPLVAFSSLAMFTFKSSVSTVLSLLYYLFVIVGGLIVLFFVYIIIIAIYGHVSPFPYMKKVKDIMPTAFVIPKRNAIFPLSIDFCRKNLGASGKISCFSMPFGSTMNKCTNLLCATVELALFSRMCDIPISGNTWIKIAAMMILLAAGSNGLVTLITVMSIAGLPVSLISFVAGIDDLIGRMRNSLDVAGDMAATVAVASNEGELDRATYKKKFVWTPPR